MNGFEFLTVLVTLPGLHLFFTFKCAAQNTSWNSRILGAWYKQNIKGGERVLDKCLLAEQMDTSLVCWAGEATQGIYLSSHKERKDYEIENHPAVAEVSKVLVGSVQCLRQQ